MQQPPRSVRLQVETLDRRELPSSLLPAAPLPVGFSGYQPQAVQAREAARRTQAAVNLKQLGNVVQVSPAPRGPVVYLGQR
jgi:hypothetical protein